jgi:hypothetical protein
MRIGFEILTIVCLLLAGCVNPAFTRLPTFDAGHPFVEKRSFERHDPFPDRLDGPDTQVRPREFNDQRTEPRRALEERLFQGARPSLNSQPETEDLRGSQYRDSVRF